MFFFVVHSTSIFYEAHHEKAFLSYMKETNNLFVGDEYKFRFGIWMANKNYVETHNRANANYKLSLNSLSHLTPTEYQSLLATKIDRNLVSQGKKVRPQIKDSPVVFDYREMGVVNPIRDQKQCGSCWAFAAVAACESNYALLYTKLPQLSEQNIIDCATTCYGCAGGIIQAALSYIINKQGGAIMKLSDYPYQGVDRNCRFDSRAAFPVTSNFISVPSESERDLAAYVYQYGVAISVLDCSRISFQLYSSGVYSDPYCSSQNLDHAMNVVGYSDSYWIMRNSWGTSWGESGYMRLAKDRNNMCGVATMATIPLPI